MPSAPEGHGGAVARPAGDDLEATLREIRAEPGRRLELVALLQETASVYKGRGSRAAGLLRSQALATFAEVGLPVEAVPLVVEALCSELDPELVAGAAIATHGAIGPDPALAQALVRAVHNLRGLDGPTRVGRQGTALLELLDALGRLPGVARDATDRLAALHAELAGGWSPAVDRAFTRTLVTLRERGHRSPLTLNASPMILLEADEEPEPRRRATDLVGVRVEDHDGHELDLADYLGRADTVVAFFYTRCQNPLKCSTTVTKLGALHRRLAELNCRTQLAAISYDPGFDLPPRLSSYATARGVPLGESVRMFRSVHGMERLHDFFGLRVGYAGSIVNQHGNELFLVGPGVELVRTWDRVLWEVDDIANACLARR